MLLLLGTHKLLQLRLQLGNVALGGSVVGGHALPQFGLLLRRLHRTVGSRSVDDEMVFSEVFMLSAFARTHNGCTQEQANARCNNSVDRTAHVRSCRMPQPAMCTTSWSIKL